MKEFTNEVIDLNQIPRYETISLQSLQPSYWKVMWIKIAFIFLLVGVRLGVAVVFKEDVQQVQAAIWSVYLFLLAAILFFSKLSFQKKGFAFREHDVIYRHGIMATNTMVIPYNRVQHIALHEGWIERWFGLAAVEIFTAGGSDSDLKIPGIEKPQAEDIKQLLMGKIQKEL